MDNAHPSHQVRRDSSEHGRLIPRYAGEAFLHMAGSHDVPRLRRLVSDEAYKKPPSASVKAEVST